MKQYTVTGMSCAACSARVEKAVLQVPGVASCSVSLLTNSMGVEGTADDTSIIAAVVDAGYGASVKGKSSSSGSGSEPGISEDALADKETPVLKKRLISSIAFVAALMYVSMGHTMWGWPLPEILEKNVIAIGLIQLLLSAIVMIINQKFFINGFKSLFHGAPNMDTLVALGSAASFVYSVYALFAMSHYVVAGQLEHASHFLHEFYFESAAMILALITVGKMLEARSKGKTTDALKSLMRLAPKTAVIELNGKEETVSIDQVKKGDLLIVRPGEHIPVDGVVVFGSSAVNEAALTGESIPVDKEVGSVVSAATLNQSGFLKIEASRVGEDTTLSQIIKMVSDAAATKPPIAKVADRVSGVFVPVVIGIAIITLLIWLAVGETIGFAIARGISVLVISCPCALGLATPVAIMVGNGVGAKHGILFKTAASIETTGQVSIVAMDKTGTITNGHPVVTDVMPAEGWNENQLLEIAYAMEQKSEHPLAKAIVEKAKAKELVLKEITHFKAMSGNGVFGMLEDDRVYGGNEAYISSKGKISDEWKENAKKLSLSGKTPLFFMKEQTFLGIIAVADTIKEDGAQAISELKNMGIRVVMLTGDNEQTAQAIGKIAGVDEVIAGVLPEGKERVIRKLKKKGKVAMVGDGINDAPALTRADIGMAIGAGTDVAIDAADVVLMKSRLLDVPAAIRLSRQTLKNIHENLFWAFIYNIIGIPLAAGAYIHLFHLQLNPMFGAAAMSLSSFCVVSNALRLNLFDVRSAKKDKKIIIKKGVEPKEMEKTLKIEGMMCPHCEARVKKCLEAFEAVEEAVVSHEKGTAVVTLTAEIADDVLKKAVEDQGYTVL